MSMILDALRRMEQERTTRRQGAAGIRPEVLRYRGRPRHPSRRPLAWVAAGIFLVAAGMAAGLLFRQERPLPAPEPPPREATSSPLPEARPALPPPVLPAPLPPAAAAPLPTAPGVATRLAPARKARAEEPPPAVPEAADKSGITISGIAWQDERRLRRAVINGALVGEGAEVAGAFVVEIKENRVLFWRDGQPFEVVYSSAFTPR